MTASDGRSGSAGHRATAGGGSVPLDLSRPRRIHLVGIGGAGMSAYASVLAAMGHRVTGSDLKASPGMDRLRAAGIGVQIGHRSDHVAGSDVVAVSSAVSDSNAEVVEAHRLGLPVVSRAELLAAIAALRRVAAVSGTHGKTTTTSMLSLVLVEAGMRPSFLVGGDVNEIGTNAVWDDGDWLVVEADESDGTFLRLAPVIAVVTNVEADHLEHYGSFGALVAAFDAYASAASGHVVVNADDPEAAALGRRHHAVTAGLDPGADYRVERRPSGPGTPAFWVRHGGAVVAEIQLAVPGAHNVANAAVAVAAAHLAGAGFDAAERALARFAGVARRFEARGEVDGVRLVDDYAHLPAEVAATIAAARDGHAGRLVVVFQPHRFTRTATLADQFGPAFAGADVVVVTDIYPAGEPVVPGVTGRLVADAAVAAVPGADVHYIGERHELPAAVAALLRPGDLCITMGAGDITTLADELRSAHR